jgi:glycerol-3-phosphate dehydrogenase (NAD(P)+)
MVAMHFTIIGDGAMGTACALLLAGKPDYRVSIWCQFEENARAMAAQRENSRFLPAVPIPETIGITSDFRAARVADAFVVAVPTGYLAETLGRLAPDWPPEPPVVSVVKGMERETFRSPIQIIQEVTAARQTAVLTGPSHAEEIARGMPASVVAASGNFALAEQVQQWFSSNRFRVYTTPDLRGAELAGALKNVIAIAAGVCDGLGFGDNAKSALMTRGLVEMTRFGVAMGADAQTFYGLAGLGDLITTCMSRHSRNRRVGQWIGEGKTLAEIAELTPQVAEGVWTAQSVYEFANKKGIEIPVSTEVYLMLHEGKNPTEAVNDLMARDLKPETA